MTEPEDGSPTGRRVYYAKSLKTYPAHDADCPFCAAGDKATPTQSVVEIDFTGIELRVFAWGKKDVDWLVAALDAARIKDPAAVRVDSLQFYEPQPGDGFRMLDTPTTAGRFGEHHLPQITTGHARALAAQQLGIDPMLKPAVKRKNEPKGKRGRVLYSYTRAWPN